MATSFAAEIAQEIGQIPHPRRLLPTANLDESEEDYNIRVGSEEDMITLDQRFVSTDGNTKIEICDLFSKKKQLIHVKKKNHSATLSHLFAQGVVSALALLEDREIHTKTKELLTNKLGFTSLISAAHFDSSEYEIAYVVVVKQRGINTPRLPFFSQVFLAQQARILRRSAFHVALQIVTES